MWDFKEEIISLLLPLFLSKSKAVTHSYEVISSFKGELFESVNSWTAALPAGGVTVHPGRPPPRVTIAGLTIYTLRETEAF